MMNQRPTFSEEDLNILRNCLLGIKKLFNEPLAKIITKKIKKTPSKSVNQYSVFNFMKFPSLKYRVMNQFYDELLMRIEGHTLTKKYFDSQNDEANKKEIDLLNCKMVIQKFQKQLLTNQFQSFKKDKHIPTIYKQWHRDLINDLFRQHTLHCIIEHQINNKLKKFKPSNLQKQNQMLSQDISLAIYELVSKIQVNNQLPYIKSFKQQYKFTSVSQNYEILSKQSKSTDFLLDFFKNNIKKSDYINQNICTKLQKINWRKSFVEVQQGQFCANRITGKFIYELQEKIHKLKTNISQSEQSKTKEIQENFQRKKITKPLKTVAAQRHNITVQKKSTYNSSWHLAKPIPNQELPNKNTATFYTMKQTSQLKPVNVESIHNKHEIVYKPKKQIDLDIYAYKKSKKQILKQKFLKYGQEKKAIFQDPLQILPKNYAYQTEKYNHQKIHSEKISILPIKIGPLIVETKQKSFLQYHIDSINLKELVLKFLIDRQKYGENNVHITIDYERRVSQQKDFKIKKALYILDCLGACVTIEKSRQYLKYSTDSMMCLCIAAVLVGTPINVAAKSYIQVLYQNAK